MSQTYTQTLHAQNVHAYTVLSCLKKSRNARLQGYKLCNNQNETSSGDGIQEAIKTKKL